MSIDFAGIDENYCQRAIMSESASDKRFFRGLLTNRNKNALLTYISERKKFRRNSFVIIAMPCRTNVVRKSRQVTKNKNASEGELND